MGVECRKRPIAELRSAELILWIAVTQPLTVAGLGMLAELRSINGRIYTLLFLRVK